MSLCLLVSFISGLEICCEVLEYCNSHFDPKICENSLIYLFKYLFIYPRVWKPGCACSGDFFGEYIFCCRLVVTSGKIVYCTVFLWKIFDTNLKWVYQFHVSRVMYFVVCHILSSGNENCTEREILSVLSTSICSTFMEDIKF